MEKDRKKLFKNNNKTITKEIKKENKSNLKNYLFIGFYLIFFLILIIFIRTSNLKEAKQEEKNEQNQKYIIDEKYSFDHTLTINNDVYRYVGKKYKDKYKYTLYTKDSTKEYQTYNEVTLVKVNSNYQLTNKPVKLFDFLSNLVVNEIIKNSSYDKEKGTYQIKSDYLLSLSSINKSKEKSYNEMIIEYSDKKINRITIDISEYLTIINGVGTEGSLELSYSNLGDIDDFQIGS